MTMHPQLFYLIPPETERVARASFPKGSPIMQIRDEFGMLFNDHDFSDLFASIGKPALSPSRLMLVTTFQFMEGLTDRQAADAVRRCLDWKYALGLELTDPGFHASVLSEFRDRLVTAELAQSLFSDFLEQCRARGFIKARGRQRTDSTHVLAAIRLLNRLECLGETLAQTLQHLLTKAPTWAQATLPADWWQRYAPRFDQFRLPSSKAKRDALSCEIGTDGYRLLDYLNDPASPEALRSLEAVTLLRRVWEQQFSREGSRVCLREIADLPAAADLIGSPVDPDARQSTKRETTWTGYKVHLTETCDEHSPNLITHVLTTPATTPDSAVTALIQSELAEGKLLPAEHLLDQGYPDAEVLVSSQKQGIDMIAPLGADTSWQARAGKGFDLHSFEVDFQAQEARCPLGAVSRVWSPSKDSYGNEVVHIQFEKQVCKGCERRSDCTKAKEGPRTLKVRGEEQHKGLQAGRERQKGEEFQQRYRQRAGVEGTIHQATERFEMRYARYWGLAKVSLQHICSALALNMARLVAWWEHIPKAKTRQSRFTAAFRRASQQAVAI